jgi:site-specific DNA recombinase
MPVEPNRHPIRVGTYKRTSSPGQKERETILMQEEQLERHLATDPARLVVARFEDDGISGRLAFDQRPGGRALLGAARSHQFDELHVYDSDRLGRDMVEIHIAARELDRATVRVVSLTEGDLSNIYIRSVQFARSEDFWRSQRRKFNDGTDRVAHLGRPLGGICPYGLKVIGIKYQARWAIDDDAPIWADKTPADIMRWVYHLLGVEQRSCRWIADLFNRLGVPTTDQRDHRVRKRGTQPKWRPGRIRNMVVNPIYKGVYQYGRRSAQPREIITVEGVVPALVSPELWQAAQDTLARYRVIPNGATPRSFLLRSIVTCAACGLRYCGVNGRPGVHWFRCNGQLKERGPIEGRCPAKAIRGDWLEAEVWKPIEEWLRNPGSFIAEIDVDGERASQATQALAEQSTLERARADLQAARERAIDFGVRGRITEAQMDEKLRELDAEAAGITKRLEAIREAAHMDEGPAIAADYLAEIRARLDAGLEMETRQKLVQLLCRVVVETTIQDNGKKVAKVLVNYRFPAIADNMVVASFSTDRGSSRPRA